ncbi:MAG: hypothetical protein JWQ25_1581 [Daejeonella sp.]|nr:hypothetical protein [Daejeonella sp.]
MKNAAIKLTFLTVAALFFSCMSFAQVTDVDGKIYKTKKISTQTWMAENLNVSHFANGDVIPEAKTADDWVKAGNDETPAWCYYDNDPIKGKKYGKLYNWYAVIDSRGLAPKGWKVPDRQDWYKLDSYLQTIEFKLSSIVNDAGLTMKTLAG